MTAKEIFTVLLALVPAFVLSRICSYLTRKMREDHWEYVDEAAESGIENQQESEDEAE